MVDRTQRILLELMKANGNPLTSAQLAQVVGVSSRTIKSTMPRVADTLQANGAELSSRRNRGYSIVVHDGVAYHNLVEKTNMQAVHIAMAGYDDTTRILHICRKLVAAPAGAKIDEICEDLCLSRSAVRRPLRQARAFCESFHLQITSSSSGGIRVFGEERMMRLAMVEFFEIHFHKVQLDDSDREYARWIGCDYQERQDIRHAFLSVLRESGISMRDSATQRMAMYFIIARNRVRAGLDVILPQAWVREIKLTPHYLVANSIVERLSREFEGFDFGEHELAFLAIWLLQNHDVNCAVDIKPIAPFLYDDVVDTAEKLFRMVAQRTGADFSCVPGARRMLEHTLLPLLVGHRYDMDGCRRFDYESERRGLGSPISVYFGNEFALALHEVTGCRFSLSDMLLLAAVVMGLSERTSFPVKPLRLLITSGLGPEYAHIEGELLEHRFSELIESVRACELYEIRGFDEREYDACITDIGGFGYNYTYPWTSMGITRASLDVGSVHDAVLINAFDIEGLLPSESIIHIRANVRLSTVDQFLSLLMLEHEGEPLVQRALELVAHSKDHALSNAPAVVCDGCLFLIAPQVGDGDERMDYYQFDEAIHWDDERVTKALFCVFNFSHGMQSLKMLERILYLLANHAGTMKPFAEHPLPFIRELVRESLKLFPSFSQ